MMRVKISEDQYKIIVKMLTNINIEKTGGSGGSSGSGGGQGASRNALIKKKKGFFSLFACFKGV
jgi:hypothetical protein